MQAIDNIVFEITPQLVLKAYACGIFPMAEGMDDPGIFWAEPEMRGILPLNDFHIPRSLRKTIRKEIFDIRIDHDFKEVIAACSGKNVERKETWINSRIRELYCELHEMGHAHSIETWQNGKLVGGLYGVRLGRAFFGESMFSRVSNASKTALVHLVFLLKKSGFLLLDTQFSTAHLERFGVITLPRNSYLQLLETALDGEAFLTPHEGGETSDSILQSFSQIS